MAGIERQVNTYKFDDQEFPTITTLADGGWVITWTSDDQDGHLDGIRQQRFDATGAALGPEVQVNTYVTNGQRYSAVTGLADGGWVVTWESAGQDGSGWGIYQQRFDANGNAAGAETRVNTYTTNSQSKAQVTALADGGWVVAWDSGDQDESNGTGLYQQRYDANGNAVGAETRVNTTTLFSQWNASLTTLADGGWVVTWDSHAEASVSGVYQQRYDANGNKVASETRINTYTNDVQQRSSVSALADGGWIVTWESEGQDGSLRGIYQQRYGVDGVAVGSENRVNTYTDGDQTHSSVAGLADGGWIVTWTSDGQDGNGSGIYQQRYDADGDKVGSEIRVNVHTKNDQADAEVVALADGGWVVTWMSYDQDGDGWGIYQREFDQNGTAVNAGTAKADTLKGASGIDVIKGLGGNDKLYGKAGDDALTGGKGTDKLYGGGGADTFVFATGDSGNTKKKADTIYDFTKTDTIDLSRWDADATVDGIQAFTFIGKKGFTGNAGELRFVKEKSDTWIQGDTNGDKKADFLIHLDDAVKMKADYFEGLV